MERKVGGRRERSPGFHAPILVVGRGAREMIKNDRGSGSKLGKIKGSGGLSNVSGDHITSKIA